MKHKLKLVGFACTDNEFNDIAEYTLQYASVRNKTATKSEFLRAAVKAYAQELNANVTFNNTRVGNCKHASNAICDACLVALENEPNRVTE